MSKTPPALRRIQHVGLKVHDLDEAVAFYRDVMGLQVSDRYEPGDNPHSPWGICFMRCGEGHHEVSLIAYPKEAGLAPKEGDMRAPEVGLHHVAFEVGSQAKNSKPGLRTSARRESSSRRGRSSTAPRILRATAPWARTAPFIFTIRAETASRFSATWPEWRREREIRATLST